MGQSAAVARCLARERFASRKTVVLAMRLFQDWSASQGAQLDNSGISRISNRLVVDTQVELTQDIFAAKLLR